MRDLEEINSDIDEINQQIAKLKGIRESLKEEKKAVDRKYVKEGSPCPKCGSEKEPKRRQKPHASYALCVNPNCNYIAENLKNHEQ